MLSVGEMGHCMEMGFVRARRERVRDRGIGRDCH